MKQNFLEVLSAMVNTRPITHKQIAELNRVNGRQKFPYEETADILNNLPDTELDTIPDIISQQERKVWKKVGIKKLLGMVKNKTVKDKMKRLYNIN